ncbi:MAG: hypothetical protein AVDCRST_MAG38-1111, partial [uncultured Solirubrobacteraceae bacterium]
ARSGGGRPEVRVPGGALPLPAVGRPLRAQGPAARRRRGGGAGAGRRRLRDGHRDALGRRDPRSGGRRRRAAPAGAFRARTAQRQRVRPLGGDPAGARQRRRHPAGGLLRLLPSRPADPAGRRRRPRGPRLDQRDAAQRRAGGRAAAAAPGRSHTDRRLRILLRAV